MKDVLEYKDYLAVVHFSSEDEVFFGKIQGINDLVTFEGSSVSELKKSFKEAVEDYIQSCKQIGKAPEKTYKGSFNVRVSSLLHRQAAYTASQKNITLNDFIKEAISYAIKHKDDLSKAS